MELFNLRSILSLYNIVIVVCNNGLKYENSTFSPRSTFIHTVGSYNK
jgi:hypothetical protein